MAHQSQFTATGPSETGSGYPRAAFSTNENAQEVFVHGVNVMGVECGVVGHSHNPPAPQPPKRDATIEGTGVEGRGAKYGVVGSIFADNREHPTNEGGAGSILGFYNNAPATELNQNKRAGVIGAVIGGGIGVVGICDESFNFLRSKQFGGIPDPAAGDGTGILGTTGTGTGVRGSADTGVGVEGSGSDAGVRG